MEYIHSLLGRAKRIGPDTDKMHIYKSHQILTGAEFGYGIIGHWSSCTKQVCSFSGYGTLDKTNHFLLSKSETGRSRIVLSVKTIIRFFYEINIHCLTKACLILRQRETYTAYIWCQPNTQNKGAHNKFISLIPKCLCHKCKDQVTVYVQFVPCLCSYVVVAAILHPESRRLNMLYRNLLPCHPTSLHIPNFINFLN